MKWKWISAGVAVFIGLGLLVAVGGWALRRNMTGPSMERHGGTILVYQIDEKEENYTPESMASALKRRLDPSDIYHIAATPLDADRMEIRIPRTTDHAAVIDRSKELISRAGRLDFRIVANAVDDAPGIEAAEHALLRAQSHEEVRAELEERALRGKPPPAVGPDKDGGFGYSWFELSSAERNACGLAEEPGEHHNENLWHDLAEARKFGRAHVVERIGLIYSRDCRARDSGKSVEFFLLCRDPAKEPQTGKSLGVTGADLTRAMSTIDFRGRPAVGFHFTVDGGERFYELTSKNSPTEDGASRHYRFLAIILDGQIMSAPRLNSPIRHDGIIEGEFTPQEVDNLSQILQAGALPATLRPAPISETAVGPTK
jgi:preprotein translocase subunit SecD